MKTRNKRALLAGLFFEAALALASIPYSVSGSETFLNIHRRIFGAVQLAQRSLRKADVDDATLRHAFQHPRTQDSLDRLFINDDGISYSEIAGIATIDYDNGPFLRFYPARTENQKFAEQLLNSDNLIGLISQNETFYKEITEIQPWLYRYYIRGENYEELLSIYTAASDNKSTIDRLLMHAENPCLRGQYLGSFHLHNDGSQPSQQDLILEHLVIVRTESYSLYRTGNGVARRISVLNNI